MYINGIVINGIVINGIVINDIFLTGIVFEAHTPLGRPGLAAESNDPIVLDDPVIKEIAVKHNASAAQVS